MADHSKLRSYAVATLLLAVATTGCGTGAGGEVPARALSAADAGAVAPLGADELLTITLDARLSTGFAWQVDEIDAAVLRLASREAVPAAAMGGMDQEILRFAGVGQGRTSLGLFYRRPWEPPGTGQVYRVDVEVAGPYAGPTLRPAAAAQLVAVPAEVAAGAIPESYNWCASATDPEHDPYARCTPVKDQGACGSCWAFATVGVLENIRYRADPSEVPDLSEQYLVSCNVEKNPRWGCDGGYVAFDYFIDRKMTPPETEAGAVHEADFPYLESDSSCGAAPHPHHERITHWGWVSSGVTTSSPIALVQQAILDHGPVWTDVCADDEMSGWRASDSVFDGSCTKKNHGVVLVGWGIEAGRGYWIMRNSWGPSWGDHGYMRIAWGANGIASKVAYAVVSLYASAGRPQNVEQGATVTLDGSDSADADGPIRSYAWVQTDGPEVKLSAADTAQATFTAPAVSDATLLTFRLTVRNDPGAESSATTTVTVNPAAREMLAKGGGGGGCGTAGGPAAWAVLGLLLLLPVLIRTRIRT
jgi:inhibitor of cysteine peptidase